ncbi:MAG TPA: hypothetical protein VFV33_02000, partial [Gemmatimonadaceae bacterium]|nr:hypothetical protein [Gemmatimonadaceae bacterium]
VRPIILVVSLAACAPLVGRGGDRGGGTGLADKPVASKEPPTTLFAADGTRGLVTEEKFRNTVLGERVWCLWTRDGGQSVASERTPGPSTGHLPTDGAPFTRMPSAATRPPGRSRPPTSP